MMSTVPSPPSFDDLFRELRELGGSRTRISEALAPAEVEEAARAMAGLERVDRDTLAQLIRQHPAWLPLVVSCIGLGLEQLRRQLRYRLGTASWITLAKKSPDRLVSALDDAFGLVDAVNAQRSRFWSFADILVERYQWSRRRASGSIKRGRRLEDDVESVVAATGLPYVMRTRFVGARGQEAPCDFAIPAAAQGALIIGAVKGFNSTGSKLSDAVREIEAMANIRIPRQFVFAFVDGIGWLGRRADLRRIYELWTQRSIDGLYSLSRIEAFRNDLTSAARRLGLL